MFHFEKKCPHLDGRHRIMRARIIISAGSIQKRKEKKKK